MNAVPSEASSAEQLFQDSLLLLADGRNHEAVSLLRKACTQEPDFVEAWCNLGFLLDRTGDKEAAELCYLRALELGGRHAQLFLNYGAMLTLSQRHAEAEAIYHEGLRSDPESPALWSNLGMLFANTQRDAHAEHCFRTALTIAPDYASARYNLGYLQLRQGQLREGFISFDARDWYAGMAKVLTDTLGIPRWEGEALTGCTIVISCEAGHGDMIQFCRYATELRKRGATRIDVLCHPGLVRLFASLDGADRIYVLNEAAGDTDWDYWSPPLSLPRHCGTDIDTIPASIPYLHATAEDRARWAKLLPTEGLRVGLVWRGNPKFENDGERSLSSLEDLAPLWNVPGVSFVSLQKGPAETEAAMLVHRLPMTDIGPRLQDFADTAAVVSQLDLVISVDTAVAHLAGALGIPCWLMLPDYGTDWRWQRERNDSPWYPGTMRLFRQRRAGEWPTVIALIETELHRLTLPARQLQQSA